MKTNPCSTSRVTPSAWSAIVQTNSSPEAIAASLNEAEATASRSQGTWHGNQRRAYPWWKVCENCSEVFPCLTKEQAVRNRFCSAQCAASRPRMKARGRKSGTWLTLTCSECGVVFERPRAWGGVMCSRRCNGKARARALVAHPNHGKGATSSEAIAKRSAKMRGANNPAWKGGVAVLNKRGRPEVLVRCPPEFASMARTSGYVLEHRLVVARAIGRPLTRREVVHHMDHDPSNNAPENLALFACNRDHKLYEARGTPSPMWCGSSL